MTNSHEDPFVKIAALIGGDEYLKVARSLLNTEDATDEEIASSTGLRINIVRKVLYDLFGKAQQRLDYESSAEFYHCGNEDCTKLTFEKALDLYSLHFHNDK